VKEEEHTSDTVTPLCFYKENGQWKERIQLNQLQVGQELLGVKINSSDLLDGKTGPKIFFECGVGRIDKRGKWQIVNGMMRLKGKPSVLRKKLGKKFPKDTLIPVFVSKIRLASGDFEVVTEDLTNDNDDDDNNDDETKSTLIPASTLKIGQELVGKVVQVRSYGCIVDVGANRNGLLHIKRVADLFQRFINKEDGLVDAGLERGAQIRVAVLSNDRKRLELDFTNDVKDEMLNDQEELSNDQPQQYQQQEVVDNGYSNLSEDELAAWAAYASANTYEEDDDYEYDNDSGPDENSQDYYDEEEDDD
jgi:predicted RNA-binding protein with RPS1 domain